jgi:hypothetical protein
VEKSLNLSWMTRDYLLEAIEEEREGEEEDFFSVLR